MTISLGFWTATAIVFGLSFIFLFGVWAGMRLALYGVQKSLEESAMKGVIRYNNTRFVAVVDGAKT